MAKLLDQVRAVLRMRHYSYRTEKTYIEWILQYIRFHNIRHPAEMGAAEMEAFLSHPAVEKQVSASTQNQALCALLFLYREVLKTDVAWLDNFTPAKKASRVPVVLTKEEVKLIISRRQGTNWLIANLLYGAGLRLQEALRLRVEGSGFRISANYGARRQRRERPFYGFAGKRRRRTQNASEKSEISARRRFSARLRLGLAAVCFKPQISERGQGICVAVCFSFR